MQCRTCLANTKEMRSIFSVVKISEQKVKLSDILESQFDYKISDTDELPQEICIVCTYQITSSYSFKILIHNSLATLTQQSKLAETIETEKLEFSDQEEPSYSDNDNLSEEAPLEIKVEAIEEKPKVVKIKREMKKHFKPRTKKVIIKRENFKLVKREVKTEFNAQRSTIPQTLYCVKCKEKFNSASELYEHCKQHPVEGKKGRPCEYCNENFQEFRSLIIHRKYHFSPFLCNKCWTGIESAEKMGQHTCVDRMKPKPKTRFSEKIMQQCHICGKSYQTGYIKIHMKIHGERTYKCKYCPKTFKVPCSLNSHVAWNHKRERNHKCVYCGAMFITASSRSAHVRKHHLKEKNYTCDTCGKQFFSKSELERHNVTHTGVRNFHCRFCEKSYQTRYGLNVHLKSHNTQYTAL